MDLTVYAVSALLALSLKGVIFYYAHRSRVRNLQTRLYILFLAALSIQNFAELTFFDASASTVSGPAGGYFYFGASIVALALIVHLALTLALDDSRRREKRWYEAAIYVPAIVLEGLLWNTPWLVAGFSPLKYTFTRQAGPLYFLFETYAVVCILAVVAILVYGAQRRSLPTDRMKNKLVLFALVPMAAVAFLTIVLLHIGIQWFNSTVTLPIATTFFLAITAYTTHQHRLFDIEFFIPWSRVRKRKTAFYDRIRAMLGELADLGSVNQAASRLAETLRCSVAFVGGNRPVLALAGDAPNIAAFPREELPKFEHIVVANEIADTQPETYRLMRQHGVAAVVPYYPHTQTAASWLLLGERFSEEVYTPLDFKMVEQLFAKLADLFLDKMVYMRTQLADSRRHLRTLELRLQQAEGNNAALREENRRTRLQSQQLMEGHMANMKMTALDYLDAQRKSTHAAAERGNEPLSSRTLDEHLAEYEARLIRETLDHCGANQAQAARLLGLKPNTLYYKLERYGLTGEKKRQTHKAAPPESE